MNVQLPPIDPGIREQLARRSGGRLPEDLLADIHAAVNAVPVEKPRVHTSGRVVWRMPRVGLAAACLMLVAVLAVAFIAVPALQTGPAASPAGYPADRALTAAELAAVMAGPALPTNTALTATVTIDARTDVCPMDRYPALGVIEGMGSQVCVVGTTPPGYALDARTTGTFAFRYLGPGVLGLLGKITPASASQLAFGAEDTWPTTADTILVDGWLGSYDFPCPAMTFVPGDPLSPNGNCDYSWLAESAPFNAHSQTPKPGSTQTSVAGVAVEAYGARSYDGMPVSGPPVHGIFVVRHEANKQCPVSIEESLGDAYCPTWLVLAKLANISVPKPAATLPLTGYPADRALTAGELATVMAGPALPTNTALTATVTIDAKTDVCPMNRYPTIGVIEGMGAQVCVVGAGVSSEMTTAKATGTFAFRYIGPGVLGLLDQIKPASDSRLAYSVSSALPLESGTFLVEGWLGFTPVPCPSAAFSPGDPLYPNTESCATNWLGDQPATGAPSDNSSPRWVFADSARFYDSIESRDPVHGVYVVRAQPNLIGCGGFGGCHAKWLVLAKLADISAPANAPTASPVPASPTPGYPASRPLTAAELGRIVDSGQLRQYDTLAVDAAVSAAPAGACLPTVTRVLGFAPTLRGMVAGIDPPVCVYAATGTTIKPGILDLRALGLRQLGYMGTASASPEGLAYRATDPWPVGFSLVEGWLDTDSRTCGTASLPGHGGPQPLFPIYSTMCHAALSATQFAAPTRTAASSPETTPAGPPGGVPIPAYPVPADGQPVDAAPYFEIPSFLATTGSVHGVFLVDRYPRCSDLSATSCENFVVLARIADVSVPTPSPTPSGAPALTGYPFDRALTTAELAAVMAGPPLPVNTTLVASVTLVSSLIGCSGDYTEVGAIHGLESQVCFSGSSITLPKVTGVFAFRYLGPTLLENLGQVEPATPTALVHHGNAAWPGGITEWHTFLVAGFLASDPTGPAIVETSTATNVKIDAGSGVDPNDHTYHVFVVTSEWTATSGYTTLPDGRGVDYNTDGWGFHVRAKVAEIAVLAAPDSPLPDPSAS